MDLASLGISIDARQVKEGVGELDKLTAAGGRAEKAVDKLGDEATQTGGQLKSASQQAADYAAKTQLMATNATAGGVGIGKLGTATGIAQKNMNKLGSEIGSLTGQLASGNIGAQGLATGIGRVGLAAVIAIPVIGALATAAGLLGLAFIGIKQAAASDVEMKKFIATLGLTTKEIEKLKDTTVTFGDVAQATFEVLAEKAGTSSKEITGFFSYAFGKVGEFGKFSAAVIYAAFVGGVKGIGRIVSSLPGMVGEAAVGAANIAVAAVEKLINFQIKALNRIATGINALFGTSIGQIADVSLGRIENKFAGTSKSVAQGIKGDFFGAFNDAMGTFDAISARATKIRQDDVRGQANDIIGDRAVKRAKAAKDEADSTERTVKAARELRDIGLSKDLLAAGNKPLEFDEPNFDIILGGFDSQLQNALAEMPAMLAAIAEQAAVTGDALASAFGNAGSVVGNLVASIADYAAQRQGLADQVAAGAISQANADKKLHSLEVRNTAQAIAGVKSLFKEKSTAFKVLSAVEKAYAAFQLATTIAAIARDATHTASSVANSAVRATADQAAGASKIFAQLGVFAFPVVAAMIGLLVALGVGGGKGGGGGVAPPSAEDLQSGAGTGSVLGDSKAKSESIANSLEIVAQNTNRDLEYSNQMLRALRSIDFGISKLAGTIARQIQVSGSLFDTSKLGLGTSGKGGFLGIGKSSTTKTLFDLGLQLGSASVADIIANGISGNTYQTVEKIKKKSGFFGIGGGTKTSYSTTTGAIDPEITSAIQDVVMSLRDGLLAAADVIGLQGAEAILDSFNVSLGKISFKDMTGQQIEDQLNAIFSRVGDDMAGAIYPALQGMQKIGEGLFETFIRVAREYEVVDIALKSIGKTFGAVGLSSVAARDALVQLFGGLDEFVEATDFFRDQFLTDAEQIAPVAASVAAELARLGMAGIVTRDQFKLAVLSLDLTTTAGREMYAALLAVAPAFDKTLDYFEKLNKTVTDGLGKTIDQFSKFAESLRKYRDSLFGADGAQGASTALLRSRFASTAALAAGGDAGALGGLESAGKAFLDSARNSASSREQYLRDVALVAQGVDKGIFAAEATADYAQLQLDALRNATTILQQISDNTAVTAVAIAQPAAAGAPAAAGQAAGSTAAPGAIITDEDTKALLQAIVTHVFDLKQIHKRWDRGDTMAVSADADTPLNANLKSWG